MSSLDYLDLCRLCLVKDRVSVPIFEGEGDVRQIFLKIAACLPVKIAREDKLPKKICDDCVYKVELFYQFWNTTANAEKQLLQWLGEVGLEEDKQTYVTGVLNPNVMKQEQSGENRLDGSVMQQVAGHQASMGMGIIDNMTLGMPMMIPTASQQQMTSVPMDTGGTTVQTVQAVPGPSTQATHDQMAQNQVNASAPQEEDEETSEEDENSDDECDGDEGLPVKEESEEDPSSSRTIEPTTFVNVSLACDEAGPSGLQQQKITEMPEMTIPQPTDADPKSGNEDPLDCHPYSLIEYGGRYTWTRLGHGSGLVEDALSIPPYLSTTIEYTDTKPSITELKRALAAASLQASKNPQGKGSTPRRAKTHLTEVGKSPMTLRTPKRRSFFNEEPDLGTNQSMPKKIPRFPCTFCGKKFTTEMFLERHRKLHDVGFVECKMCKARFQSIRGVQRHYDWVHKGQEPGFNLRSIRYAEMLQEREEKLKKSKRFKCTVCVRSFSNAYCLRMHKCLHDRGPVECEICKLQFKTKSSMKHHFVRHHTSYGAEISLQSRLSRHKDLKVPLKYYRCNICSKDFHYKDVLEEHKKTHALDYLQCSICNLKYKTKLGLQQHHVRAHSCSQPKFECDYCGARFKLKGDLTPHIFRKHLSSSKVCSYCGKEVWHLRRHERAHHEQHEGQIKFPCHLCNLKFFSKIRLENHLLKHKWGTTCLKCGEHFAELKDLATHKREKHFFTCDYCQQHRTKKSELLLHIQRIHLAPKGTPSKINCVEFRKRKKTPKYELSQERKNDQKVDLGQEGNNRKRDFSQEGRNDQMSDLKQERKNDQTRDLSQERKINRRSFPCQLCMSSFSSAQKRNEHKKIHEADYIPCSVCGLQFRTRIGLTKHHARMHDNYELKINLKSFRDSHAIDAPLELLANFEMKRTKPSDSARRDEDIEMKRTHSSDSTRRDEDTEMKRTNSSDSARREEDTKMKRTNPSDSARTEENTEMKRTTSSDSARRDEDTENVDDDSERAGTSLEAMKIERRDPTSGIFGQKEGQSKEINDMLNNTCNIETLAKELGAGEYANLERKKRFACGLCTRTFKTVDEREEHKKTHKNDYVECSICGLHFKSLLGLKQHRIRAHETEQKLKKRSLCRLCRRSFATEEELEEHRKIHGVDFLQCTLCDLKLKSLLGLKQHYIRAHNTMEPKFICDHCGNRFKLKNDLFLHIQRTHMSVIGTCRFCGRKLKDLKNHEARHRQRLKGTDGQLTCSLCGKTFWSQIKLDNHISLHMQTPNQELQCPKCDLTFQDVKTMSRHRRLEHRSGPFTCTICQKVYPLRNNFYQHVLTHAGIKPYKCDICKDVFSHRTSMLKHRKTHPVPLPPTPPPVPIAQLAKGILQIF
ncbi:zinc finger protein 91 [Orussus abietinus]|uniref:zinc finger protein 91 n=1 Tax=Orussus abietinus TaxID=222816 RepID=UPI0006259094|nr:zinc finger protein 91 [Orussus abietinus]